MKRLRAGAWKVIFAGLIVIMLPITVANADIGLDSDAVITTKDAVLILQVLAGKSGFTEAQKAAADLNLDGKTDNDDALFALEMVAGLKEAPLVADDFVYVPMAGNNCRITGYRNDQSTTVVIPNKFGQCTVTEIGENAFSGKTNVRSVTMPVTIKAIGSHAFSGCTALTEVAVPALVTTLETGVFEGCTQLSKVVLHDGVTVIGARAFKNCSKLATITRK
ncbi:MAG: leucine-rich repeat protein [Clostridia bacterium]